jgi:peroxiredoxin
VIQDFSAQDYRGKNYRLSDFADRPILVVAFLGIECPLAKLYAPRLDALARTYADRGVAVLAIDSNEQDTPTEIGAFVRRSELTYPVLVDAGHALAEQFAATRTPEVIVLDASRTVRYRGRIDDQYQVGVVRDHTDREDLRAALDELLAGQPVTVASTRPVGCLIGRRAPVDPQATVNYSEHIAPLLQRHCQECHREGEIAPFSLLNYADAAAWGPMLTEVVDAGRMPPWHANPEHGDFANARGLSAEERQLLTDWVQAGCPEGDPARAPAPREFTSGWQLPQPPDEVFFMRDMPFEVPADAGREGVRYQNFRVDPGFTEDRWVTAAEVQPGNRAVVHHIIVYVDPPEESRRGRDADVFFAAYVPGLRARLPQPGYAKKIPAGSSLRFQVHYTPIGTPQSDLSRVGFLYGEPEDITHEIITTEVANPRFVLQPETDNQVVTAESRPADQDLTLLSLSPHMHLRGASFRYELQFADGLRETILDVPRYDFNWQTTYVLREPRTVPAGTRMLCTAVFDNSASNLANPDPSATVRWGEQSWDEMMIGYFDVVVPVDERGAGRPIGTGFNSGSLLKRFDTDGDGRLSREEVRGRKVLEAAFGAADANRDDLLDAEEIAAALRRLRRN